MRIFAMILCMVLFTPAMVEANRGIAVVPVSPAGDAVSGKQWLMVIGINDYLKWPKLSTAVNDAKAVKDVLLERYYFDQERVVELYDTDATRRNILKNFRDLAKKVKPEDSLMIFYAGHGHIDPLTKEGSWVPVESDTSDPSAWLSNHAIKKYLSTDVIKAKHILLVSDSCFSGDFFRGSRGALPEVTDKFIKKAYSLSSRQALTSGGLEPVSDAGFGGHSVFAHFMLQTLKNNNDPYLVPSSFFSNIRAGVSQNADQLPTFGSLHNSGGQQGGEMVLFLKQAERAEALDEKAKVRWAELERLKQMEAEAVAAKKREDEELARKKVELDKLDAEINAMKGRIGTAAATSNDSLDNMIAMVEKKEAQELKLNKLRQQREAEEAKRQVELAQLRAKQLKERRARFNTEYAKYQKIAGSKYGESMKDAAWMAMLSSFPEGVEVKTDDIEGLRNVGLLPSYEELRGKAKADAKKKADAKAKSEAEADARYRVKVRQNVLRIKKTLGDANSLGGRKRISRIKELYPDGSKASLSVDELLAIRGGTDIKWWEEIVGYFSKNKMIEGELSGMDVSKILGGDANVDGAAGGRARINMIISLKPFLKHELSVGDLLAIRGGTDIKWWEEIVGYFSKNKMIEGELSGMDVSKILGGDVNVNGAAGGRTRINMIVSLKPFLKPRLSDAGLLAIRGGTDSRWWKEILKIM